MRDAHLADAQNRVGARAAGEWAGADAALTDPQHPAFSNT